MASLPVPLTLLAISSPAAGTHTSNSAPVPPLKGRAVTITFTGLTAADYADAGLGVSMLIQGSDDAGLNPAESSWYALAQNTWGGGDFSDHLQAWAKPDFGFRLGEVLTAQRVRAVVVTTKQTTWGVVVTVE